MINESTNMNTQVTVKDTNGADVQVAYLSATLDTGNQNINIVMSTTNKELVLANAKSVKKQYEEFMASVSARAKESGFVIF